MVRVVFVCLVVGLFFLRGSSGFFFFFFALFCLGFSNHFCKGMWPLIRPFLLVAENNLKWSNTIGIWSMMNELSNYLIKAAHS